MSTIFCPNHPTRNLTNFCSSKNCMVSLCPQCLPSHLRSGTCDTLNIDVLDGAISKAKLKAQQSIKQLNQHMNSLTKKRAGIITQNQKQNEQTLQNSKRQLQRVIDGFFDSLKRRMGVEDSQEKIQRTLRKYQKFKQQINENLQLINNPTKLNNSLKTLTTIDTKSFLLNLRAETDFLFSNSSIYKIFFSPECTKQILSILQNHIQIKQHQQPFTEKLFYPIENHQFSVPDYFNENCQFKIVHQFSAQTSSILLTSLTQITPSNNIKQKRLALSSPQISQDSKSIITHNGDVYTLGGTHRTGRLNRQISRLNFNVNSLQAVGSLIFPRKDPSVAYLNGNIYIVSGVGDNNQQQRRCQAFNTSTRQSVELSSCRYSSGGASLCTFQGKYLLKFGGYDNNRFISVLQKYDIRKDIWTTVQLRFSQQIPPKIATMFVFKPYALAHQINSDSIVLSGGDQTSPYNQSVAVISQQSPECFVVRSILANVLPQRGFYLSQPIIHKKTVHTLFHPQNQPIKLLVSDLSDWIIVS